VHDGDESGCAGVPSNDQAPKEKMMPIRTMFDKQFSLKRMNSWLSITALAMITSCGQTVSGQIIAPAPRPSAKHIYSDAASPKADIAAALAKAKKEHKRVILDFGGDWCGDCQVLDIYFHQAPNEELLEKNFVLVPRSMAYRSAGACLRWRCCLEMGRFCIRRRRVSLRICATWILAQ